jgi:hypothetical protein
MGGLGQAPVSGRRKKVRCVAKRRRNGRGKKSTIGLDSDPLLYLRWKRRGT